MIPVVGDIQNRLALLLLLARIGDIGSTYLATPTLKLEGNPIIRAGKWKLGLLTLAICLVPYVSIPLGVVMLTLSLFLTSSNLAQGWLAYTVGEDEYLAMVVRAASRSQRRIALAFRLASAGSLALAGAVLLYLSGGHGTWAYWFALGILLYALTMALFGSMTIHRIFALAAATRPEPASAVR